MKMTMVLFLMTWGLVANAKASAELKMDKPFYEKKCITIYPKDDGSFIKGSTHDICEVKIGNRGVRYCVIDPSTTYPMAVQCDLFDSLNGKN